ncbi:MAG: hypothetical protein QG635_2483 [Bacteroidota bacterium]|nr:hypothetical protein [Bacteroidota bacterium]
MNIYVGNLPFTATEEDLKELFSQFGPVQSAKIIMDRETDRSKGFGFVEMSDNAARKAITELKDSEMDGKQLTINEARPRNNSYSGGGSGGGNYRRRSY